MLSPLGAITGLDTDGEVLKVRFEKPLDELSTRSLQFISADESIYGFIFDVIEAKDTQHKGDIEAILESVPAKGIITSKGTLCVFRKDLEQWKQQIRKKYLDK